MSGKAFKAVVSGVVQGVGFRYFTYWRAREYGLFGYVKNLPDGTVEVYAEGEEQSLHRLLNDLREGPSGSVVQNVKTEWTTPVGRHRDFVIAH